MIDSAVVYRAYQPIGKTLEQRMKSLMDCRAAWFAEHPEAATCTIILHKNNGHDYGFWLTQYGVAWKVADKGGPQYGSVWFAEG